MAQVPYNPTASVQPTEQGTSYLSVPTNVGEFGGLVAGAEQKLGGEVGQSANDAQQAALALQNRQNQVVSNDAFNQYQSHLLDLTAGNPSTGTKGYFALQGKEAMDAYPDASKQMEDARTQISNGLNPAQRLQFEESSRRLQMYTLDSMRNHFIQQQNVYGLTVNAATQANAERAIGVNVNSDQAFNDNLFQMRSGAVKELQNKGVDANPDVVHNAVEMATQRAIVARVQGMIASDPVNGAVNADAWLKNGQIPDTPIPGQPQTFSKVTDHLEPSALEVLTRTLHAAHDDTAVANFSNSHPLPGQAPVVPGAAPPPGTAHQASFDNNVGNLRASPAPWSGKGTPQNGFETFATPEAGVAAATQNIMSHAQRNGGSITLSDLIGGNGRVQGWAPASDGNDPVAYAARVSKDTGIGVNDPVPTGDPAKMAVLVKSMTAVEKGRVAFGDDVFQRGVQVAMGGAGAPQPASTTAQPGAAAGGQGTPTRVPEVFGAEADYLRQYRQAAEQQFPGRPDLVQRVMRDKIEEVNLANTLYAKQEAETAKAQRDAQDKILNDAITVLNTDPTKFDPGMLNVKDAAGNYVLTPQQRDSLDGLVKRKYAEKGIDDIAPYGPGYSKAYTDILAPDGTPGKINDLNDILKRGGRGGDLSTIGVQKLAGVFTASRKSPDEHALAVSESGMINYAKTKLLFPDAVSSDIATPYSLRDPKGEAIFNAEFLPRFEKAVADAKGSNDPSNIWKLLTRKSIDEMVGGMRSPAQMAQDRMEATGETAPGQVEAPGTPIPPPPLIQRVTAPGEPAATVPINDEAWARAMAVLPHAINGRPYSHVLWAAALTHLMQDPSEKAVKQFDEIFSPSGYDGATLVKELGSPVPVHPAMTAPQTWAPAGMP